ncbi:MAG: tetratricopeptide repeat protein [Ignavibacteriaceae bacterium]
MALTKKQKNAVLAERNKLSPEEISKKFNIPKKEVDDLFKKQLTEEKPKRNPAWFYVIAVIIPVLFFVILEIALRLFNYGFDYTQWVKVTEDKFMLNPDIARRYFYTTESVPYSNQNSFDIVKKNNSFRVFILGESSAAGYPFSPNGDFGRYIKKRLELSYPSAKIEMVNLGITAVNSYTLRDLMPGVIDQKPDLILIYTGHNEYYGALGVGSAESFGSSRFIVNSALYLNRFKTFQLMRNILKSAAGMFAGSGEKDSGGTLMARIAKDKLIKLNSDVYYAGLEQYRDNMNDILEMAKDAGVKVMLSTLTYNLKDQPPFVTASTEGFPDANNVFNNAIALLKQGDTAKADSLFRLAKDLDGLKFRAPEALNNITRQLGKKFNYPVVEADREFDRASPDGITGNNLMIDHLHPTLSGYQLLGKLFYNIMTDAKYLPDAEVNSLPEETADSAAIANFYFSKLDSTIAHYRIIILKNDWPFSEPKSTAYLIKQFDLRTQLDSVALRVIDNKIMWEAGHREAAVIYFNSGDYRMFTYEINLLTDQYPFIVEYYDNAGKKLLEAKQYDYAYDIFLKRYKYSPSAISAKWLGIIELSRNNTDAAINYLKQSTEYDSSDPQVLFNLAGAYSLNKDFENALKTIDKCLSIDPNFPQAQGLKQQITAILKADR